MKEKKKTVLYKKIVFMKGKYLDMFQEGLRCNLTLLVNLKEDLFAQLWDTCSLYWKESHSSCVNLAVHTPRRYHTEPRSG